MSASSPGGAAGPSLRAGLGIASVALAVALLIGFKAPQDGVVMGAARNATGTSGGSRSTASGTFDGSVIDTRYGSVQVEISVKSGKVTSVTALALPVGGRSGMISSYAGPILSGEALSAQSASIDIVSGATYTSDAYAQSLQAALDQAGI